VTGAKEKDGRRGMGQQGDKLGRVGRPAHACSGKEGQWPGRVCGLRKKKKKSGSGEVGRKGERGEGRERF
jgi:hypothetical protein